MITRPLDHHDKGPGTDPDGGPDWVEKKCKDCQKIVQDAMACINWGECKKACRANLPRGTLGGCEFDNSNSKDLCKKAADAYSCHRNLNHCKNKYKEACPTACSPHQRLCSKDAAPGYDNCEECLANSPNELPEEYRPGGIFGCSIQNFCCTQKFTPSGGKVNSCINFMKRKGCCTIEGKADDVSVSR
jgi:hypothetical protein